jgi:hypothetical protein
MRLIEIVQYQANIKIKKLNNLGKNHPVMALHFKEYSYPPPPPIKHNNIFM